jgi:diguanylate cyclase (GGDEF)-like protein
MRYLLLVITLLSISFPCIGAEQYRFHDFPHNDKLPSKRITALHHDRQGFMWIGTDSGLLRFDGYKFKEFFYNPNKSNHLSNNFITEVFEATNGDIWVGTESGLNKINPDLSTEQYFLNNGKVNENFIFGIFEHKDDFYIGTLGGTFKLKNNIFDFYSSHGYFDGASIGNNLYMHDEKVLHIIDNGNTENIHLNLLENETIKHIVFYEGSINVFTSLNYLISFKADSRRNKTRTSLGLGENDIFYRALPMEKNVFLLNLNNRKIVLYNAKNNTIEKIDGSFNNGKLEDLHHDSKNNIWITTTKGILYYSAFQVGSSINPIIDLQAVTRVKNNYIHITKKELSIDIGKKSIPLGDISWVNEVVTINNNVFMATNIGVYYYSSDSNTISKINNKAAINIIGEKEIYTVDTIGTDQLAISGENFQGLAIFGIDDQNIDLHMNGDSHVHNLNRDFIYDAIYTNSSVFVATSSYIIEIDRFHHNEDRVHYLKDDNTGLRVQSLLKDKDDSIWAGTQGLGLVKFDTNLNTFTSVLSHAGKNFGKILNLLEYKDSILATSQNEIIQYDKVSKSTTLFPNLISISDISFVRDSISEHSGMIYVASNKGVVTISPENMKSNANPSNVSLSNLRINNQDSYSSSPDLLNIKNQSSLEFQLMIDDHSYLSNRSFKYQLYPLDKEWRYTQNNEISYTNLHAGAYELIVFTKNGDGKWNTSPFSKNIHINQPLWLYIIVALSTLLIAAAIAYYLESRKQKKRLSYQAEHDELTGIYNRYFLNDFVSEHCEKENDFALIWIDLDNFKEINDEFGHGFGDQVLIALSKKLQDSIESHSDTLLARNGGDEFTIVMPYRKKQEVTKYIKHLVRDIFSSTEVGSKIINNTASIGVVFCPENGYDQSELFKNADIAMYEAKRSGKNNACYFKESMKIAADKRNKVINQLKNAIQEDELHLVYQPKINKDGNEIVGYECLIRWINQELGFVPPDEFIEIAEANGFIIDLGYWIIEEVCKQIVLWEKSGELMGAVAINVSAVQLQQNDFVYNLNKILTSYQVDRKWIEIEVTETAFCEDIQKTKRTLKMLKDSGIHIALDDFGTGYSSLNYLSNFPLDSIKIDKSFVDSMDDVQTAKIIKSILLLAGDLNYKVVIEGVEDKEQLEKLSMHHFDSVQGYYYSKPLKPFELTSFQKAFHAKNNMERSLQVS